MRHRDCPPLQTHLSNPPYGVLGCIDQVNGWNICDWLTLTMQHPNDPLEGLQSLPKGDVQVHSYTKLAQVRFSKDWRHDFLPHAVKDQYLPQTVNILEHFGQIVALLLP